MKLISLRRFEDPRGFFSETYNKAALAQCGVEANFVQDNLSFSKSHFTIRGIHFQTGAFTQGKLVHVLRGSILDAFIDLRPHSATFLQHGVVELSAENWHQLWIPRGFGHGFCTLVDDTLVTYKVDVHYSVAHEAGIVWNDPDLNVAWPCHAKDAILSDKDARLPRLSDISSHFSEWFHGC